MGLCRGTTWGRDGAQRVAAQGRRRQLHWGAVWGCAGAQQAAAVGRSVQLRKGTAWGCVGVQQAAVLGRSPWQQMCVTSLPRPSASGTVWKPSPPLCWLTTPNPCQSASSCLEPLQRRSGAGSCAGAQQAAAQGHSVGLRRCAAGGCARAQRGTVQRAQRGAAMGHSVGLRRGAV